MTCVVSLLVLQLLGACSPFLPVPLSGLTVMVDPGHGGVDPGAHYKGEVLEKDLVLDIGGSLVGFLKGAGARVLVTRSGDNDLAPPGMASLSARKRFDLRERVSLAEKNGADILISLHVNSSPSNNKSGAFVLYNNRPEARDLALAVEGELKGIFPGRGCTLPGGNLYILRSAPMPAVIVEAGFISNPADRKALSKAEFRRDVAWAVFAGLEKYYRDHKRTQPRASGFWPKFYRYLPAQTAVHIAPGDFS